MGPKWNQRYGERVQVDTMNKQILVLSVVVAISILAIPAAAIFELPSSSEEKIGMVTDKRVDTWGTYIKSKDYVVTVEISGEYTEVLVNADTYARLSIGDQYRWS